MFGVGNMVEQLPEYVRMVQTGIQHASADMTEHKLAGKSCTSSYIPPQALQLPQ
jgi:hypothetical protein